MGVGYYRKGASLPPLLQNTNRPISRSLAQIISKLQHTILHLSLISRNFQIILFSNRFSRDYTPKISTCFAISQSRPRIFLPNPFKYITTSIISKMLHFAEENSRENCDITQPPVSLHQNQCMKLVGSDLIH